MDLILKVISLLLNYERLVLAPRFLFFRSSYFVLGSPFLNSLKIYILY